MKKYSFGYYLRDGAFNVICSSDDHDILAFLKTHRKPLKKHVYEIKQNF